MPDTLLSLGIAVAFVLPGFLIADLAEVGRSTRAARSDLELVLRGLVYALILQGAVALTGWTDVIVGDLSGESGWQHHLVELAVFAIAVGIVIPTWIGLALNRVLRRAEQSGQLGLWYFALGGRDYRDAWDYVFAKKGGAYVLLTVSEAAGSRHLLAKYGAASWASRAPTRPQELYVEEVWPADENGVVDEETLARVPARGMWISAEKIERLEILEPGGE